MTRNEIRELLTRVPFEAFRIRLTSGDAYEVRDANSVALGQSRLFIFFTDADEWAFCPYLHIASVESIANGRRKGRR